MAKAKTATQVRNAGESFHPNEQFITICSNIHQNGGATGYWDMWLTLCGAMVYTPCNMSDSYTPAEVALGDFCQTQKINRSDSIIVLVKPDGSLESYIIPWINHALGINKKVYTDRPVDPNAVAVRVKGSGLLREIALYPLTKAGLEAHMAEAGDDPIPAGISPVDVLAGKTAEPAAIESKPAK